MPRVKRGVMAAKRKRKMRSYTKGFKFGRNSKITRMTEATLHAFTNMFIHRRKKKGDFRTLWNVKINAGARANGLPYNKLIHGLKKRNILLDRKILADLAATHPQIFTKLVEAVK
ncbi:50S ribosomal protein L20 [Candidatus Azambacteria bacterium]|nr:50S ribosomal protein L20 [Candidatus Azambacteria bacterium]